MIVTAILVYVVFVEGALSLPTTVWVAAAIFDLAMAQTIFGE